MLKRFGQYFSATPVDPILHSELQARWQYKILQSTLGALVVLAALIVVRFVSQGSSWITVVFSTLFVVVFLVIFLLKKLGQTARASITLVCLFLFAIVLAYFETWTEALLLLVGFTVLCCALLQKKWLPWAIMAALLTLLGGSITFALRQHLGALDLISRVLVSMIMVGLGSLIVVTLHEHWNETQRQLSLSTQHIIELNEKIAIEKKDVENSLSQMRIATGLAQIAATASDMHTMQKRMADLIQERFQLYFVGVYQLDRSAEHAVLQYGTGEQGRRMLTASYRLTSGGYSLVGRVIHSRQAAMVYQNDSGATIFENPFLPETRSELAIPLLSGGAIFGVLNVHAIEPDGFDLNTRLVLQEAADMLALAFDRDTQKITPQKISGSLKAKPLLERELAYTHENPVAGLRKNDPTIVQIPLRLRDETIGSIELEIENKELSKEKTEFLNTITTQTAIALENASLLNQTLQRAERERKVLEITSKIRSTNDSQEMLQIALNELSQSLGVDKAQIILNIPEKMEPENMDESDTRSLRRKHTTGHLREL